MEFLQNHLQPKVNNSEDLFTIIYDNLNDDWDKCTANTGCAIIKYFQDRPIRYLEQVQFATFRRITEEALSDTELYNLLTYFCGERAPLLTHHFVLIEGDECTTIPYRDLAEAEDIRKLYNPKTGEEIEDYVNNIYVTYDLSSPIKKLKESKS